MRNLIFFLNIQHKQEYRVSCNICVIYVRGHVRHDDNRMQSIAVAADKRISSFRRSQRPQQIGRDGSERQKFPNQNAPLTRSTLGTMLAHKMPEILFSLVANDCDAAQMPMEKCGTTGRRADHIAVCDFLFLFRFRFWPNDDDDSQPFPDILPIGLNYAILSFPRRNIYIFLDQINTHINILVNMCRETADEKCT